MHRHKSIEWHRLVWVAGDEITSSPAARHRLADAGIRSLVHMIDIGQLRVQLGRAVLDQLLPQSYLRSRDVIEGEYPDTTGWYVDQFDPVQVESRDELPSEIDRYTGRYEPEPLAVAGFTDVSLVGYMPVGIWKEQLLLDTVQGSENSLTHHLGESVEYNGVGRSVVDVIRSLCGVPSRGPSLGTVFPLVCTNGYYHWVLEYLPRLRALFAYERQSDALPTVLLRSNPPTWMYETLTELGVPRSRCAEWSGRYARAERVITCTHRVHYKENFNPCLADYRWLRSRLTADVRPASETLSYVYISRSDADERRIVNESAVIDALSELGFRRYVLSSMSIDEQIRLFYNADIVVAPHGAGLVNMLFGESMSIVELFPQTMIEPYYYLLADVLGHGYSCAIYPSTGTAHDFYVDVETLTELVAGAA